MAGTIKLNVGTDDSDVDRVYYAAARNSASYPLVTDADSFLTSSQLPYYATLVVGGSSQIGSDEIKLTVRFWNAATGFGQEVRHSITAPGGEWLASVAAAWDDFLDAVKATVR